MKKEYIKPHMKAMNFKTSQMICASFGCSDDNNTNPDGIDVDAKDYNLSEEDLYEIFLGWDKFFD